MLVEATFRYLKMIDLLSTPSEEIPQQLILIKYPGIVKNLDKALNTMGGIQQITTNHFNKIALELNLTPENPYTSRIVADRRNEEKTHSGRMHFVIKVKRKKTKPEVVKTEIVGLVNTVYTFNAMCDFQYLPLKKRPQTSNYDDMIPNLIPTDMRSALYWWGDGIAQQTSLFLPPYQFSRYLTPSDKILARETDFSAEKTKKVTRMGFGQNLRVERKALSITVQATDEFPSKPCEEASQDSDFRCKHEEPHRLVRELFEERPMWTRVAVVYRTGLEESLLKFLLQKYAFYIQSGPWGRLWCRFGYDPRTDKNAGKYQTLMVSFRQHGRIPERHRLKVSTDRLQSCPTIESTNEPIHFEYEKGKLPRVRQMWYCLQDVHLEEAKKLIDEKVTMDPEKVAMNGWIAPIKVERIRDLIKEDVKRTSNEIDEFLNETMTDEEF